MVYFSPGVRSTTSASVTVRFTGGSLYHRDSSSVLYLSDVVIILRISDPSFPDKKGNKMF